MADTPEMLEKLAATQDKGEPSPEGSVPPQVEGGQEPVTSTPPPASATLAAPAPDAALTARLTEMEQALQKRDTELAQVKGQLSQYSRLQMERELEPQVRGWQQYYVNQGKDEETARQLALAAREIEILKRDAQNARATALEEGRGYFREALELSKKHEAPLEELLNLPPGEMRSQAQLRGEIAKLKKQVAANTQATVPAQSYEGGQAGVGTKSDQTLVKDYNDGKSLSPAERKRLDEILGIADYLR